MSRDSGYWWSPDGQAVLATRVDEAPVQEIWITGAADPTAPPRAVKYRGPVLQMLLSKPHVLKSDGFGLCARGMGPRYVSVPVNRRLGPARSPDLCPVSRPAERWWFSRSIRSTGKTSALSRQSDGPLGGIWSRAWPARLSDGRLVTVGGHR